MIKSSCLPSILLWFIATWTSFGIPASTLQAQITDLDQLNSELTADDQRMARQISNSASTSEWLGPLAPVALSPYFGITCLAGMAQFGEGTILDRNNFVSQNRVLKNPAVFWVFLVLTIATSVPRFSKVSKPVAQFLDRVETYSALITLLIIRLAAADWSGELPENTVTAGAAGLPAELLLMIAAAVNVLVISTVRFVFELVVWLSPFPTLDAIFEVCNKTICAGLMMIYAFNPFLALLLNILLFSICAIAFLPMYRRAVYLRSLIVDPVLSVVFPGMARLKNNEMIVFNRARLGTFAAKSRLYLRRGKSGGWVLRRPNWLIGSTEMELPQETGPLQIQMGILLNRILVKNLDDAQLIFSRRYSSQVPELVKTIGLIEVSHTIAEISPA